MYKRWSVAAGFRVLWMVCTSFAVESLIFGIAVLPAAIFWEWHFHWNLPWPWLHTILLSMAFIPAYVIFAFCLMVLSAFGMRCLGWRTPVDAEMPIDHPDWPLMNWARYEVSIHLVRIFAGMVFRSTWIWTLYMRLNGAKIGRRCFINSLWVTDHNLLEFGNDVVIGSEVHLSGHTVERGVVRTASVRFGDDVTVGVSSVIGIGVEAGSGCHIGALSLVPKFTRLDGNKSYAGIPVRPIESRMIQEP